MGKAMGSAVPGATGRGPEAALPTVASLAPVDVAGRLPRLQEALGAVGVDGLVVTNLTNVRYLTGFTGSAAVLTVTADSTWFVTDGRYATQAPEELSAAGVPATVEVTSTASEQQRAVASAAGGLARVGLEADHVSWSQQRRISSEWLPAAEVVPTSGLVEGLRLVKDDGEVDRMALAAAIADVAFTRLRNRLADRPTEAEFALELDTEMRRLGAADVSFETIVASGANAARPHHRPGDRVVAPGDLVVCDFGALVDGYHSDMTRTVWVGEPDATQRRMWEVVAEAQAAGVALAAAGVTTGELDHACRAVIDDAGWAAEFVHSTGHGVGLDIHEDPRVGRNGEDVLAEGWVVTVEPGVYVRGVGGVRIEDTVLIEPGGCRVLTLAAKDPAV